MSGSAHTAGPYADAMGKVLDRWNRAKGKGGYPTSVERHAMEKVLEQHADLVEALKSCQSALSMLTEPDAIKTSSALSAWTRCVAAETNARDAISRATGGEGQP